MRLRRMWKALKRGDGEDGRGVCGEFGGVSDSITDKGLKDE